jgi:hypothetical protein
VLITVVELEIEDLTSNFVVFKELFFNQKNIRIPMLTVKMELYTIFIINILKFKKIIILNKLSK